MLSPCRATTASLVRRGLRATSPLLQIDRRGIKAASPKAATALAKKLLASFRGSEKKSSKGKGSAANNGQKGRPARADKARVNIVSEELCDGILDFMGPSLERHKGCDLIDISPGVGLWSKTIRDFLQPRSHIMMEPDFKVYEPFLQEMLESPGTKLVPKSGIAWEHLNGILTPEYLPHQTEIPIRSDYVPQRNDTLLVIANFCWSPPRKYGAFASVSQLLLYQFMASIRSSSLFQKYGLVRMLIWVPHKDKMSLLPRSLRGRGRLAIEGEIQTEWIKEITQQPDDFSSDYYIRHASLERESTQMVLERVQAAKTPLPPKERQSRALREVLGEGDSSTKTTNHRFEEELRDLNARYAAGEFDKKSDNYKRIVRLRYRSNAQTAQETISQELDAEEKQLEADILNGTIDPTERAAREAAWNDRIEGLSLLYRQAHLFNHHGTKLLRQDPPVLTWDRREFEPWVVQPTEFLPNHPCSLLDIQPKAVPSEQRSIGAVNKYAGETFDLILSQMMHGSNVIPVSEALNDCWPGAAEEVLSKCPSITDPARGGSVIGGQYGELCVRMLNEHHLAEIMEAWMKWPFRPTFRELLARIGDDNKSRADEVERPEGGHVMA